MFFKVLKSGFKVEDCRLNDAERLIRYLPSIPGGHSMTMIYSEFLQVADFGTRILPLFPEQCSEFAKYPPVK